MVQILPNVRKPSFSQSLGQALGAGIGSGISSASQFAQQMALQKQKSKLDQKIQLEEVKSNALRSIEDMRDIISRGKTGWNIFNMLTPEGRADRAALDTSALNLERLAADMVGRGTLSQTRFNYLKERLPSSYKTDAENQAILDEWKKILGGDTESLEDEKEKPSKKSKSKSMFDSKNPEHQAKAKQLYKHYKDKEKVREILRREFEGI